MNKTREGKMDAKVTAFIVILGLALLGVAVTGGYVQEGSGSPEKTPSEIRREEMEARDSGSSPPATTTMSSDQPSIEEPLEKFRGFNVTIMENRAKVEQVIENDAIDKWTKGGITDWEMVDYTCENQEEALDEYLSIVKRSDFEGTINEEILMVAFVDWPFDFEMIMYTYENQMEAYRKRN